MARILTAAGFTDIAIAPFDASVPFGEGGTRDAAIDDAVKMALEVGPLSRALAGQPDDIRARASAAVRDNFTSRPPGVVRFTSIVCEVNLTTGLHATLSNPRLTILAGRQFYVTGRDTLPNSVAKFSKPTLCLMIL